MEEDFPLGLEVGPPRKDPAWERVQLARHAKRPHAVDHIERVNSCTHNDKMNSTR